MLMPIFSPSVVAASIASIVATDQTTSGGSDHVSTIPGSVVAGDMVLIVSAGVLGAGPGGLTIGGDDTVGTDLQPSSNVGTDLDWHSEYYTLTSSDITAGSLTYTHEGGVVGRRASVLWVYLRNADAPTVKATNSGTAEAGIITTPAFTSATNKLTIAVGASAPNASTAETITAYPTPFTDNQTYGMDNDYRLILGHAAFTEDAGASISSSTFTRSETGTADTYCTVFEIAGA